MVQHNIDIAIHGAGMAGLWVFNRLKRMGYDVLLLDTDSIGGEQSMASQGIIHSGLKYAFGGKINKLAASISAMPDQWREALTGHGPVDLSAARVNASSQYLLIPRGAMGGLLNLVTKKTLGKSVHDVAPEDWPTELQNSGFNGSMISMGEPVLDIPSAVRALAEPYRKCIKKSDGTQINAKLHIYTAAAGNLETAKQKDHDKGLETQHRPLLMGLMKNAPFPLYAHLVGASDKPIATITTHTTKDNDLVWYIGGLPAERPKESDPQETIQTTIDAFAKYLPDLNLDNVKWATLPIDRVEGKSKTDGWMPDTPTIHDAGNHLYCWPTKLTFSPMLSDMIVKKLEEKGIKPSGEESDFSDLPDIDYRETPWDTAQWTK